MQLSQDEFKAKVLKMIKNMDECELRKALESMNHNELVQHALAAAELIAESR